MFGGGHAHWWVVTCGVGWVWQRGGQNFGVSSEMPACSINILQLVALPSAYHSSLLLSLPTL